MGKTKTSFSSSSANENMNIGLDNPKKQINKLLVQSANLTSKNRLLQKGLANGHVLNKKISQSGQKSGHYASNLANRKVNAKVKKMKEIVSSSYESSEEDTNVHMPINTKKERLSTTEESELSDNGHVSGTICTLKNRDNPGNSKNYGSDPEEKIVKNEVSPLAIQSPKKMYFSSCKSETDSESNHEYDGRAHLENEKPQQELDRDEYEGRTQLENEILHQELGVDEIVSTSVTNYRKKGRKEVKVKQSPKKKLPVKSSSEDDEDTENNFPSRQINEAFNLSNVNNRTHRNSDTSETEEKEMYASNKSSWDRNKKTMDQIEEGTQKLQSGNISDRLSKSKVNVLQNVLVAPSKPKTLKDKLEEVYPGIRQTKSNIKLEFSKLEDVYLFRIPKNVNPCSLKDAKINLEEECKVKVGEKYCIKPTPKVPGPTLVVSDNCKIVQFKGNIKMQKYVKSKKKPKIVVPEKTSVPLPDNLKKRHPLFGPRYKHRIKLSEEVEKKLDEAIVNVLKKKEKPKKKTKKPKLEAEEGNQEDIFTLLNSHSLLKKKIKKETSDDSAFCSSSSIEKTMKKNRKDKNINPHETLVGIKSEVLTENDSDVYDKKSSRKSVNKRSKNEEILSTVSHHNVNRLSIINSTLMPDILQTPNFNPEVSKIESKESGLERQCTKHYFDPEFSKSESSSKGKSKKSKKKRELDEERSIIEKRLISDVLNHLKDDHYPSKKLKKKKIHKSRERVGST